MAIPLPELDDRRWAELVEEGRALIPVEAPEWTDHNVHDPGITLIELLAWITEQQIYRLNRIPERHRRKFLSLIGMAPRPPGASRVVLSFNLKVSSSAVSLPASIEFAGQNSLGEETRFRTLAPINIAPGELQAVLVKNTDSVWQDFSDRRLSREGFPVFGNSPNPGPGQQQPELYLGFSVLPQNQKVSLYFTMAGPHSGETERRRLIQEARLAIGELPQSPSTGFEIEFDGETAHVHHSVRTVWEYLVAVEPETWRPFKPEDIHDDTRAFTLDGAVTMTSPEAVAKHDLGGVADELYYIRCRCAEGVYESPPVGLQIAFNAVRAEQAVPVGKVSWFIAPGAALTFLKDPAPGDTIRFLTFNEQREITEVAVLPDEDTPELVVLEFSRPSSSRPGVLSVEAEILGGSTGRPHQTFSISEPLAIPGSVRIFTIEGGELRFWERRPDFDASRRDSAHFLLEQVTGHVTFGDGEHGRVPARGAPVYAACDVTRADRGNLAEGAVNTLVDSAHNRALLPESLSADETFTIHSTPASGGAAPEALTEAVGRAITRLSTPLRAVTLEDYQTLALETPGVRISRARALANYDPDNPAAESRGIVTVVILPYLKMPEDSEGSFNQYFKELLKAVADYLSHRKIIGTRVRVTGPDYLDVAVRATVAVQAGQSRNAVRQRILTALDDFFDPLRGGPEGTGWPFARAVFRSEVLQVIDEIPGVDHVSSLVLDADPVNLSGGSTSNLIPQSRTTLISATHSIELVSARS